MNSPGNSPFRLSEPYWKGIILALSAAVLILTVWCLTHGITTIFMHLYYFPIVLLAYRYRWKGFGLATALALAYLGLVIAFDTGQPDVIMGAFYRFLVFVGIAAVIAYLSDRLLKAQEILQQSSEVKEQYISLAPAIVLVLDRNGMITFLNRKGGEILDCIPEEVTGKSWINEFLPEKERERINSVFAQLVAGHIEENRAIENPVLTRKGTEKIIRWNNTVLHDESGSISGILGFGEDITEEKWAQNALRELQQFQESVIANANVWISVLDPDGTILVWNDAAEAISGYEKTGVLGKRTIWKKLYPDSSYRKKVTGEIQRIIGRDEFLENFETEIRCADGSKKTIVWNTRGLRDNAGVIMGYIAIGRDVTAQKSAESRAGESSRFLAAMINTLPIPVFFKDTGGKYLGCNPLFEEFLGLKRDQIIGKTAYDIAPKDLADRYTAADRQILDNPIPQKYETQVQYANGSRHDVIFYKAPFFNKDGSVGGLIGAYLDITERKSAEEQMQESEEKYRAFFSTSRDCVFITTLDGSWVDFNEAAVTLFGYDNREDLRKIKISQIYANADDRDAHITHIRKEGYSFEYPVDLRKKDGTIIHTLITTVARKDSAGNLLGFQGSIRDITEWKATQDRIQALLHIQEEQVRIINTSPAVAFLWRAEENWPVETVSENISQFGYSRDDFISGRVLYSAIIHPDDLDAVSREVEYNSGHGIDDYTQQYRIFSKNRQVFWVADYTHIRRETQGKITHYEGIILDITERKRVEEMLRQNQLQLANAMDIAHLVNWEFDVATGMFTFDDRFYSLFGTTAEREGGNLMSAETYAREFVHPDDSALVGVAIHTLLGTNDPGYRGQMEHRIIRRDGEVRTIIARYAPVMDEHGKVIRTFGANQDITERKQAEAALLRSEEWYRTLADALPDQIFINGRDGTIQYVNAMALKLLHLSPDQVIGKLRNEVFPPEIARVQDDAIRFVFETGEPVHREDRIQFGEQESWIDASLVPLKDEAGTVTSVLGVAHDITERKQIEDAIRSREEQFRAIFHTQQTGLMMVDAETHTITDANTAALSMIGVSRDEVIGKVCHTFVCPAETGKCPVTDLNQTVDNSERVLIRANGERVPILKSVSSVKIGGHPFLIESFIDLSDRKKMEKEITESRQLFADIISFLPDPTFVIDKDGKVLAWNRALEQISGVPSGDMVGKGEHEYSIWMYGKRRPVLINLVLRPDLDAARLNYTGILWEGSTVTAQTEISRDGKKIPLSLVASPLIDSQGKITGAIESMRDISHVKEAEAALTRLNASLEMIVHNRTRALEEEVVQRQRAEDEVQGALDYTRSVIEANPDLMVVLDDKGTILDVNAAGEVLSGLPKEKLIGTSYFGYLVEDGTLADAFSKLLKDGRIENTVHLRRIDGRITPLSIHATVITAMDGTMDQIIVSAHDITRQKQDEEAIRSSLDEKVLLLREIHHRVKNNLQIIISLTNLQMRQTDDPAVKQIMSETQNRVRAMSLVHEKLYRSESLSRIDFADYTRFLATQLFSYYGMDDRRVRLEFAMGKIMVDINTAVPLGLLMNELISNALKHAFPNGKEGMISITGSDADNLITLAVRDNGIGIPKEFDWQNTTSLGMRLVTSLTDQVDGTIALDRQDGTTFTISVKRDPAAGGKTDE